MVYCLHLITIIKEQISPPPDLNRGPLKANVLPMSCTATINELDGGVQQDVKAVARRVSSRLSRFRAITIKKKPTTIPLINCVCRKHIVNWKIGET